MPYVRLEDRTVTEPLSAGILNYLITQLLLRYVELHGKSYDTLNSAIGALECAKVEFYRRVVIAYEEKKRAENGDVYSGI